MAGGLKVYYLPLAPMVDGTTMPTFVSWLPLFRNVCAREGVTVVHGHQVSAGAFGDARE